MNKGQEELRKLCSECERHLSLYKKRCPFRSISNEYCDEYDNVKKELKKPKELYNKIKQKRDSAENDYENQYEIDSNNQIALSDLSGQISAYNDILSLMESMFEVKDNE